MSLSKEVREAMKVWDAKPDWEKRRCELMKTTDTYIEGWLDKHVSVQKTDEAKECSRPTYIILSDRYLYCEPLTRPVEGWTVDGKPIIKLVANGRRGPKGTLEIVTTPWVASGRIDTPPPSDPIVDAEFLKALARWRDYVVADTEFKKTVDEYLRKKVK